MGRGLHAVVFGPSRPDADDQARARAELVDELRHDLQVIRAEREYATLDTIAAELIERGWHR